MFLYEVKYKIKAINEEVTRKVIGLLSLVFVVVEGSLLRISEDLFILLVLFTAMLSALISALVFSDFNNIFTVSVTI
ncbi:hypothetical protein [Clostridium sp. HBUAS56017]|uniref:hypothetical protein n=1 Tax=Clostridium sp. HBUAS56017 TaxID=2571128 RepID=UPI001177BE5F|nr:hypothetical protein [Clostridium sp. HBUAS56017]